MGIVFLETLQKQAPVILGELEPISLLQDNQSCQLKLQGFRPYQHFDLPANSPIFLRYPRQSNYFLRATTKQHECSEHFSYDLALSINAETCPDSVNFYLKLLNDWRQQSYHIDWRELDECQKAVWLELALLENGIQQRCLLHDLDIDCRQINSERDLFCYLGELMIDKYCYIGRDLDGLEDCLLDLEFKPNFTMTFHHSEHLAKVLTRSIDQQRFLDLFYDTLYSTGRIRLQLK